MELARKKAGTRLQENLSQVGILNAIEGGKSKKGIEGLMKKGDVQLGKAPKTLPETLKRKKDRLEF